MNIVLLALVIITFKIYEINAELTEVVDLTWKFDNDTIYWKGVTPLSYTKKITRVRDDGVWYVQTQDNANDILIALLPYNTIITFRSVSEICCRYHMYICHIYFSM